MIEVINSTNCSLSIFLERKYKHYQFFVILSDKVFCRAIGDENFKYAFYKNKNCWCWIMSAETQTESKKQIPLNRKLLIKGHVSYGGGDSGEIRGKIQIYNSSFDNMLITYENRGGIITGYYRSFIKLYLEDLGEGKVELEVVDMRSNSGHGTFSTYLNEIIDLKEYMHDEQDYNDIEIWENIFINDEKYRKKWEEYKILSKDAKEMILQLLEQIPYWRPIAEFKGNYHNKYNVIDGTVNMFKDLLEVGIGVKVKNLF